MVVPKRVRKIQLEQMAAGAFLDAEAALRDARACSPAARGEISPTTIHRGPHANPCADPDDERVVVVDDFSWQLIRVVDPDRLEVQRDACRRTVREMTAPSDGE